MSKLIIKKRVNLDFLGEDYKEAYLVFKSIPLKDYEAVTKLMPKSNERYVQLVQLAETGEVSLAEQAELKELREQEVANNLASFTIILDFLKKYYVAGQFPDDNGKLEKLDDVNELDNLDKNSAIRCFEILTGQDDDPKGQ